MVLSKFRQYNKHIIGYFVFAGKSYNTANQSENVKSNVHDTQKRWNYRLPGQPNEEIILWQFLSSRHSVVFSLGFLLCLFQMHQFESSLIQRTLREYWNVFTGKGARNRRRKKIQIAALRRSEKMSKGNMKRHFNEQKSNIDFHPLIKNEMKDKKKHNF